MLYYLPGHQYYNVLMRLTCLELVREEYVEAVNVAQREEYGIDEEAEEDTNE